MQRESQLRITGYGLQDPSLRSIGEQGKMGIGEKGRKHLEEEGFVV